LCALFIKSVSFLEAQQLQYGPEAGFNLSGAIVKDPGGDPHGTPLPGFQLGGFVEYSPPNPNFSVGGRLLFSYEGYMPTIYDTKATIHVSFIKIPLNVIYKSSGTDSKWKFGLGPYFGIGVGGHYTDENTTGKIKINFGNNANNDDLKRVDIGADLMAAYEVTDQIWIRGTFDFGLANYLTPGSTQDASAHSLSFGITGYYLLSK
jgi:hypothetical protein